MRNRYGRWIILGTLLPFCLMVTLSFVFLAYKPLNLHFFAPHFESVLEKYLGHHVRVDIPQLYLRWNNDERSFEVILNRISLQNQYDNSTGIIDQVNFYFPISILWGGKIRGKVEDLSLYLGHSTDIFNSGNQKNRQIFNQNIMDEMRNIFRSKKDLISQSARYIDHIQLARIRVYDHGENMLFLLKRGAFKFHFSMRDMILSTDMRLKIDNDIFDLNIQSTLKYHKNEMMMRIYFKNLSSHILMKYFPSFNSYLRATSPLSGEIRANFLNSGEVKNLTGFIKAHMGDIYILKPFHQAYSISSGLIYFNYDPDGVKVILNDLSLGNHAGFSGKMNMRRLGDNSYKIDLDLDPFNLKDLKALWPNSLFFESKNTLKRYFKDGYAQGLSLEVDMDYIKAREQWNFKNMRGRIHDISGLSIVYHSQMPPIDDISGHITFNSHLLEFNFNEGQMYGVGSFGQGQVMVDFDQKRSVHLKLNFKSPVPSLIKLMNHEVITKNIRLFPLNYEFDGNQIANIYLGFPLKKTFSMDDINLKIQITSDDFSIEKSPLGLVVGPGDLNLELDEEKILYRFHSVFNEKPFFLSGRRNFQSQSTDFVNKLILKGHFTNQFLYRLYSDSSADDSSILNHVFDHMTGLIPSEIEKVNLWDKTAHFSAQFMCQDALIDLSIWNFVKSKGETCQVNFDHAVLKKNYAKIKELAIYLPNLSFRLQLDFDIKDKVSELNMSFNQFRFGGNDLDAQVRVRDGSYVDMDVRARVIDMSLLEKSSGPSFLDQYLIQGSVMADKLILDQYGSTAFGVKSKVKLQGNGPSEINLKVSHMTLDHYLKRMSLSQFVDKSQSLPSTLSQNLEKQKKLAQNFTIFFDIDQLLLLNNQSLYSVEGSLGFDGNKISRMSINGLSMNEGIEEKKVFIKVNKDKDQFVYDILADDAGVLLDGLNLYSNIKQGQLSANGTIDSSIRIAGQVHISDYYLQSAPMMAHILGAASLFGLIDQMTSGGVSFHDLSSQYVIENGKIIIENMSLNGPSLGFTASGMLDTKNQWIEMNGEIIPIYLLNSFFVKVPILSNIFSMGQGLNGLFTLNYTMTGGIEKPKVNVNLISGIFPGFLKKVFFPDMKSSASTKPENKQEKIEN